MRVSNKLILGFAVVIFFAVMVGIIGITGMDGLRSANLSVYNNQVLGLEYIGRATAAFKQMQIECRQAIISSFYDDAKGTVDAKERFEASSGEFSDWLNMSAAISDNSELTIFYEYINEIFVKEYMPKAAEIIEISINDMPDHVNTLYINALLASLVKTGEQMENLIIGSMDLNTALAAQANDKNDRSTRLMIWAQTSMLGAAVFAAVLIALYITRSITAPINESAGVLSEIACGGFDARVTGNYKGEFAVIKYTINDTAEKLSAYLKEKIKEERARELTAVLAIADAGILIKDENGLITEWNVGAEKILGYSRDEIIGKSPKSFSLEEAHKKIDDVNEHLRNGRHIAISDDVRVHKEGYLVDCSASYTPLFSESGTFEGSLIVFHDATEKKSAEQKLKRLAAIVSIADAGIIVKDKDGVVREWNIGAENILGYTPDEMFGHTTHFYAPEESHAGIDEIEARLAKGEHIDHVEVVRKDKNGRLVDCSASYTPIFDDNRNFTGSVAIFHDISDKKRMELELKKALLEAEAKHQTIMSSMEYARKIQKSLLPKEIAYQRAFSDYSVIWKPRDTVGGDIYWIKNFSEGTVLCTCDCTGHGTPGALLTMLVISAFEATVNESNCKDTAQIIWELEQRLVSVFNVNTDTKTKSRLSEVRDGCDLAVLYIANDGSVTVSSGNIHIFICDGINVSKIKGQRIYIGEGGLKSKDDIRITLIPAKADNKFYIASDGLYDQIGGEYEQPFGYRTFKQIILHNHNKSQSVISDMIWDAFESYRGGQPRRDDVGLITFKPRGY